VTLTFDLLTLNVVSESYVTWATSVPVLVFLDLSVVDLSPMYATDRRKTSDLRQKHHLMPAKRSCNRLRNIESVAKFRNWVTSPTPRPFRGQFAICEEEHARSMLVCEI